MGLLGGNLTRFSLRAQTTGTMDKARQVPAAEKLGREGLIFYYLCKLLFQKALMGVGVF